MTKDTLVSATTATSAMRRLRTGASASIAVAPAAAMGVRAAAGHEHELIVLRGAERKRPQQGAYRSERHEHALSRIVRALSEEMLRAREEPLRRAARRRGSSQSARRS